MESKYWRPNRCPKKTQRIFAYVHFLLLILLQGALHAEGLVRATPQINLPFNPPGTGYRAENAFPTAHFEEPVEIVSPPGETNRLFVVEKAGTIKVIGDLRAPNPTVFLDISSKVSSSAESGLLGLAFHPSFRSNSWFYVVYTAPAADGTQWWRLARFSAGPDPNQAVRASEVILISQRDDDSYHEGGHVAFGPDGYLYVSIGDGGGSYNARGYAQRIDQDFFSGILRLDVDNRPENLAPNPHKSLVGSYRIPADNPFVGATSFNGFSVDPGAVRTEFYAVGLRNPFRFSFDSATGEMFTGDVGQARREELDWVIKGGNYGWPFEEGLLPVALPNAARPQKLNFIPPVADYGYPADVPPVTDVAGGYAIAGVMAYRGKALPALSNACIISDFIQGKVGVVRFPSSETAQQVRELQTQLLALRQQYDQYVVSDMERALWEQGWGTREAQWQIVHPESLSSLGSNLEVLGDDSVFSPIGAAWAETYEVTAPTTLTNITGVRLELLPDSTLPEGGPGTTAGGTVMLSEFRMEIQPLNQSKSSPVAFSRVLADFSQDGFDVSNAIDGDPATHWGIHPQVGKSHAAIFECDVPVVFTGGGYLDFFLEQNFGFLVTIGRFRLSITTQPKPLKLDPTPASIVNILKIRKTNRSPAQQSMVVNYYKTISPALGALRLKIEQTENARNSLLRFQQTPVEWILDQSNIASFGINPATGDLLMADLQNGAILKLVENDSTNQARIPLTLSGTGIFRDLATLNPSAGVLPYEINHAFWSDGARKSRWFGLLDPFTVMVSAPEEHWEFPAGTVWVKHFDIDLPGSGAASRKSRRIETRVLVRGDTGLYGVTYKWNSEGTDATLVPPDGAFATFVTQTDSQVRTQAWRYPSRSDCLRCHTAVAGFALGFNTPQLNRLASTNWPSSRNQIEQLSAAGYLSDHVPSANSLRALASLEDTISSREYRVRSFLQANCAQCHRPGAIGGGLWDARIQTPLPLAGIVRGLPAEPLGDPENRLIAPGSLEHSLIYRRLAQPGAYHMPPLATGRINDEAVKLLADWIMIDLPQKLPYAEWAKATFEQDWILELLGSDLETVQGPEADPDGDGESNYSEYLTGHDPMNAASRSGLGIKDVAGGREIQFTRPANLNATVEWIWDVGAEEGWIPLDTPENKPWFPATATPWIVRDNTAAQPRRFYRVRLDAE